MKLPGRFAAIRPDRRHWVTLGIAILAVIGTFFVLYRNQTHASPTPAPVVQGTASADVNLAAGDSLTVNCPNALSYVASSPSSWVIACLADTPTATETQTPAPTDTPTSTATATATQTATDTATPTPTPTATATSTPGCTTLYPFGPMGLPVAMLGAPYTGSALSSVSPISTSPNYVLTLLAAARTAHARVLLSLQGGRQLSQNADGSFSLSLWETQVDKYSAISLTSYIADGTLIGSPIIDEPNDRSNWNGHTVADADIDAAAGYLQAKFPGLTAYVGSHMSYLTARGYAWQNLHGAMIPFTYRNSPGGDVIAYMDSESALAAAHGFSIITNLNGPNGAIAAGKMTAAQLTAWGTHAIGLPNSRGTFIWVWSVTGSLDGAYFKQAAIVPVMLQLAAQAAARTGCAP